MRTCLTLLHQALRKEMLQQYCQANRVVHDRPFQCYSSRCTAWRISSGEVPRCYCVSPK